MIMLLNMVKTVPTTRLLILI